MTSFTFEDPTDDVVLDNAKLVLADRVATGGLRLRDGRIFDMWFDQRTHVKAIDLDGDYLMPGLVELHTDNLETQLLPRIGAAWPPTSAVISNDAQLIAAGITTTLDAITLGDLEDRHPRVATLIACVNALDAARDQNLLRADHWLHLRCELAHPELPDVLRTLVANPRVRLLSLMDHTPGQRQYHDAERYRSYYARSGVVWSDAEFAAMIRVRHEQQQRFREVHLQVVLDIARAWRLPLASHDDANADDVAEAHRHGARFAEFPTSLAAAEAARELGLLIVAGAPNLVRGGSHSGNVAAIDLAHRRCLDILSSDFVPSSLLDGVFILHERAGWALPDAVAAVTRKPAHAVGFDDRGSLAVGLRADVIRVRKTRDLPVVLETWVKGVRRY